MGQKRLSKKQLTFIDLFDGNGTEAARAAGYSTPETAGKRCLQNVQIRTAIEERRKKEIKPEVMTRIERQAWWTKIILDETQSMKDRLRASELLGKSEGDFLDRIALGGDDRNPNPIRLVLEKINGTTKGIAEHHQAVEG